jgi:hypothetical protein
MMPDMEPKTVPELERLIAWADEKAAEALSRFATLDRSSSAGSYSRAARKGEQKTIATSEADRFRRIGDGYRRQLPADHPQYLEPEWRPARYRARRAA